MNKDVKTFIDLYKADHKIITDFYELLDEKQYDFRMTTVSDTPRQSFAHILEVILMYLNGIETGELEFKGMGVDHYWSMKKSELLGEDKKVTEKLFDTIKDSNFKADQTVKTPWGEVSAISTLYALKSHEILHTGWNLAIMDHLGIKRYESLSNIWG